MGWTDYPVFRRVEEIGRDEYERVLFGCVPPDDPQGMVPSDYIWLSLVAWCPQAEAARVPGGLCLRMPEYHGDGWLTALIATPDAARGVYDLLSSGVVGGSLHYVPKWIARGCLEDPRLTVEVDRDNFDYVHDLAMQHAAEGAAFREARRRRRQFARDHPEAIVRCCEEIRASSAAVLTALDHWATGRNADETGGAEAERSAICRLLDRDDLDRSFVALLEEHGECVGFLVAEVQPDNSAVVHFMKTIGRVHGATEVLQEEMFARLLGRDVVVLNVEQDLGIAGLRRRKLDENPAFLLEKNIVRLRRDLVGGGAESL